MLQYKNLFQSFKYYYLHICKHLSQLPLKFTWWILLYSQEDDTQLVININIKHFIAIFKPFWFRVYYSGFV